MVKINVEEDCGNAPKKILLRDFNIAFAENDLAFLVENIADGVRCQMVGDKTIEGKEQFSQEFKQLAQTKTVELTLANIMTHGNVGAVDGTLKLADGSTFAFCDVYKFSSAKQTKIKEITSYVIQI